MKEIKRAMEIKEKLNLTNEAVARMIGISPNALSMWVSGKRTPRKASLQKIQRFIDKYENGTLELPKPKQLPKNDIENIENVEKRPMYELIYKLEEDYDGHLRNVPDDDPILPILKKMGDGVL